MIMASSLAHSQPEPMFVWLFIYVYLVLEICQDSPILNVGKIMLTAKAILVIREYFTVEAIAGTRAEFSSP
jgi:hypothetical protein